MIKFKTTAAIFIIGVLASKFFAGAYEPPIFNRFAGEIREVSNFVGPKAGIGIQFEIFNQFYAGNEIRFIEFDFLGNPESLKKFGAPESRVSCSIDKIYLMKGFGKSMYFDLSGDHYMCTGLKINAQDGDGRIAVQFQGNGKVLYTEAGRNNSRGFIVGLMQGIRYSNWTRSAGGV
ncbi:hypothetical protein OU997_03095 [Pseudomonas sp. SL4(2022)]|uniref:hypothetical protein n=1 Tax=Pseudomonas sp. SL4(2022) TaxID=2994661 RepID=UPI00226EB518|nr:hypothetical protein [Pseudomonas sp. SL4(2022)]WAC45194.1 hypothetical protein OU997_03095 [Pseudomonas sp. SL4(2022)]